MSGSKVLVLGHSFVHRSASFLHNLPHDRTRLEVKGDESVETLRLIDKWHLDGNLGFDFSRFQVAFYGEGGMETCEPDKVADQRHNNRSH